MKIRSLAIRLTTLIALATSFCFARAAEQKKVAGPNGGRILEKSDPRAEFLVTADRKVQITFLDAAGRPIAPAEQIVTVVAGQRIAPKTLTFSKIGGTLVSTSELPAGDDFPTVVQIKPAPGAKTISERFTLDLDKCGECKLAEYACICAH